MVFNPGPHGHPDQESYILVWEDLAENPPPWVAPFLTPKPPLPSQAALLPLKPSPTAPPAVSVLPESQPDFLLFDSLGTPPPYNSPQTPSTPQAPSTPQTPSTSPAAAEPQSPLPPPQSPLPPPPQNTAVPSGPPGPAGGTHSRTGQGEVAVTLPLRPYGPMLDDGQGGEMPALQYWPFSTSDLYNWKNNSPSFSEDPTKLTSLLDSLMFSHQPTWDDMQQILGTLFTTEERDRILLEARKAVPGRDGRPTQQPDIIDEVFPLTRPDWDPNDPEGRRHLQLYRQTLMAGLQAAARRPTNFAKVREVQQGPEESPSMFLERLLEAFRRYTPYDPSTEELKATVALSFIGQAAPDIRKKLQRMDGLQNLTLGDLVKEAEKMFYKRETVEEKEQRLEKEREEKEKLRDKRRDRELTKILATVIVDRGEPRPRRDRHLGPRPRLGANQCAHCREEGHWARDCPKKKKKPVNLLAFED
ncbi:hypothetical protein STEG23_000168 [Scotinomys teguina]